MTRRLRSAWLALAIAAALLLTGCTGLGGDDGLEVTATFSDVIDLVPQAAVRAGDVQIGTVTDIELVGGERAQVTMAIEPDTGLPAELEAVLAKSSLLGERYVDLRPAGEGGELSDGTAIEQTRVLNDFEDLVASGSQTLALVSADLLGAAVETGARAFGGRGSLIGQLVEDLDGVVGRYEAGSDDVVRLIDTLSSLTDGLADDAEANAAALGTLEDASQSLQEEDDRLVDALSDLEELASTGETILADHRQEIRDAVRRLRIVLAQVTRVDGALSQLLVWSPRHNIHVPNGVVREESTEDNLAQVWLDFIVCGVDDTEGDPSRDCTPPNPGESNNTEDHPRSEECWDDLDACREETDREQAR